MTTRTTPGEQGSVAAGSVLYRATQPRTCRPTGRFESGTSGVPGGPGKTMPVTFVSGPVQGAPWCVKRPTDHFRWQRAVR